MTALVSGNSRVVTVFIGLGAFFSGWRLLHGAASLDPLRHFDAAVGWACAVLGLFGVVAVLVRRRHGEMSG